MFADWRQFVSAFSTFYITKQNKQLKFLEISITGLFSVDTADETKAKFHVFRQREMIPSHLGSDRRTSTRFPPVTFPASHAQWIFWLFLDLIGVPVAVRLDFHRSLVSAAGNRACVVVYVVVSLSPYCQ